MGESQHWTMKCYCLEDGVRDATVDLPPELLRQLGAKVGDSLTIKIIGGAVVLLPVHHASSPPPALTAALPEQLRRAYRMRLEAFLQIPVDASDQAIHEMIEAGFALTTLVQLYEDGVIAYADFDGLIPSSIEKTGLANNLRLKTVESDRLFRTVHIIAMAEAVFGSAKKAKSWLSKPKSRFLGRSPIAMISTFQGTLRVEEMLIQIIYGLYS